MRMPALLRDFGPGAAGMTGSASVSESVASAPPPRCRRWPPQGTASSIVDCAHGDPRHPPGDHQPRPQAAPPTCHIQEDATH